MIKIVTHNAKFHADDVFAVAALFLVYEEENCEVVRTRDEEKVNNGEVVVDVGGVYNPNENKFDHHQLEGAGLRKNGIPYASFGLVWDKYGEQLSGSLEIKESFDKILVQAVDALDNGVDVTKQLFEGVRPFDVVGLVDLFRPTWNEEKDWDKKFLEAVSWAKSVIVRVLKIEKDLYEAREVVRGIYRQSTDKEVILIDEQYDFGREVATSVLSDYPEPIYAILYRSDANNWQVLAIRKNSGTHESRKLLPEDWRAKSGIDLQKASGIMDAEFCHRSGFMALVRSKEGAIALAKKALDV